MVAIPSRLQQRNEANLLVSFFFVLIGFTAICPSHAWQPPDDLFIIPATIVRERIEQAGQQQWLQFVQNSAQAILGESWRNALGPLPPADLPKENRVQWFSERIKQWTQSRSFVDQQTQAWLAQRCKASPEVSQVWDFGLHDGWVQSQILRNVSFLRFVQGQIAGDLLFDDSETRLGTAMWFRSLDDPQSLDSKMSEDRRHFEAPRLPTSEDLPNSLRWTHLSRLAWLYSDASESQRRRLLDLEAAMESILRSEQRDWQRLRSDESVIRAHRAQSTFPTPSPADRVFQLAEQASAVPTKAPDEAPDPYSLFDFPNPWRHTQPWSAILEFEVQDRDPNSQADSFTLVRQRSSNDPSSLTQPNVVLEWDRGRVRVRLIHALPYSYLEIETEPVFQTSGVYSLAVVYEGLPSAENLRIWSNGRWLPSRVLHDGLVRDVVSSDAQVLVVANPRVQTRCQLTQLECYRIALSGMELSGWSQDRDWKDWESSSREEQLAYCEHYARRVDLQWRYQRESLLFYADSFASALAKVGLVPSAESTITLQLPKAFAQVVGEDVSKKWSAPERRSLATRCGQELSGPLARNETLRQWQGMLASSGFPFSDQPFAADLERISQAWRSSWDRTALVEALLLSESWTAIAIDFAP